MPKNKSVHCIECTKVIFTTKDDKHDREMLDIVIKCPECKTLQRIETEMIVERKIIVKRIINT